MPLRFTIRDLLWLTVVVALAMGWWRDHRALVRRDDPVAETYFLKNTDPNDIRQTVRSVFSNTPSLEIAIDARQNAVVILARPSQQVTIRDLVEQLDMPFTGPGTRIIRLNSGVAPVDVKAEAALLQVLGDAERKLPRTNANKPKGLQLE